MVRERCPTCNGRGTVAGKTCLTCYGTGYNPRGGEPEEQAEIQAKVEELRRKEEEKGTEEQRKKDEERESLKYRIGQTRPIKSLAKAGTRKVCKNPRCGWVGTQGEIDAAGGRCPRCGLSTSFSTQRTGWGDFILWLFYWGGLLGLLYVNIADTVYLLQNVITQLTEPAGYGWAGWWLSWFFVLLGTGYVAWKMTSMNIRRGLFWFVVTAIMLIMIPTFVIKPLFGAGGTLEGPLTIFGCIMGNLANPGGLTACLQSGQGTQAPVAQKTGGYKALNIKLGSEFTEPKYQLQPILWTKDPEGLPVGGYLLKYIFPLTIENPNDDLTIKNVVITDGRIVNETQYEPPIAGLVSVSDRCMGSNVCEIKPLDKLLLTVATAEDSIPYGAYKRPVTIELSAQYNFSNDGKNGLVFVKSINELKNAPSSRPETGKGPLDIVVYFTPEKYLFDSGVGKVYAFINLMNKGSGHTNVNKIKIIRSSNDFLSFENCRVGGQELKPQETENTIIIEKSISIDKNRQFQVVCEYNLSPQAILTEPYRTITFSALVNFTYKEKVSQDVPIQDISGKVS